jgi:HEPN domain-containing protein/predicted nucleotidyltransferase
MYPPRRVTETFLNEVTDKIVQALKPEKIFLFGSYAYGNPEKDSDIDLFIIMETSERPAKRRIRVSRLFWDRPVPMDFVVKTPTEIAERISMGDFFIKKILTKGKVLYDKKTRWGVDLQGGRRFRIRNLSRQAVPDSVCFHYQQCIEKYLKAFLISNDIEPPEIHDLQRLKTICGKLDESFEEVSGELDILNAYAVNFRYPGEAASLEEANEAVLVMRRLHKFIRDRLKWER